MWLKLLIIFELKLQLKLAIFQLGDISQNLTLRVLTESVNQISRFQTAVCSRLSVDSGNGQVLKGIEYALLGYKLSKEPKRMSSASTAGEGFFIGRPYKFFSVTLPILVSKSHSVFSYS